MDNRFPADNRGVGDFSHKAPVLSTDMRCYFGCKEGFKKDVDLRLHIKLRHRNENENELRRAFQDAEEEIALTSSSASTYQCALCPKKFSNHNTFWAHITKRVHNMLWPHYKEQYGSCEVESSPFECKICGRVIKYIRDSITKHLRMCHQITWPLYVDRIRKLRSGQTPEKLPNIDFFECKICNSSVKYCSRGSHLQGIHKITESEYLELFQDGIPEQNVKKKETLDSDRNNNIVQSKEYFEDHTTGNNDHTSGYNGGEDLPLTESNYFDSSDLNQSNSRRPFQERPYVNERSATEGNCNDSGSLNQGKEAFSYPQDQENKTYNSFETGSHESSYE